MMQPLKPWQKIFAYTTLAIVLAWTAFGIYAIYILLRHGHG